MVFKIWWPSHGSARRCYHPAINHWPGISSQEWCLCFSKELSDIQSAEAQLCEKCVMVLVIPRAKKGGCIVLLLLSKLRYPLLPSQENALASKTIMRLNPVSSSSVELCSKVFTVYTLLPVWFLCFLFK